MNFIPIMLIATGAVILAIALLCFRKPKGSTDHIGVHRKMNDDAIGQQLQHRPPRAEAGLCVFFGGCFILVGIIWQGLIWYFWWGVGG